MDPAPPPKAAPTQNDAVLAQGGLVAAAIGLLLWGLSTSTRLLLPSEWPIGLLAGAFVLWYGLWWSLLRKGLGTAVFRVANPAAMASLPLLFLASMIASRGPEPGAATWLPPMMFSLIVSFSALRMSPRVPLLISAVTATGYALMIKFWIQPLAGPLGPDSQLTDEATRSRLITLMLMGFAAAGMARALRRTLDEAVGDDRARTLFGKYVIKEPIASGGMGTVFRATYCPEGGFVREVAVKRLHDHLARDPSLVDAFRQEAELCSRLAHPNIVAVLDFGRTDDSYFLAMEYVDGWSLRHLLERAESFRFELSESLVGLIGTEMLSGLDHAHDKARGEGGERLKIVHRDLSPANVLISRVGEVKIVDFGIARSLKDATEHQTQHLVGKLTYLAPEVAAGKPFDTRADLYAIGLILYELLTLQSPRRRASETSTWRAVLKGGSPGVSQHRENAEPAWGPFFTRALARDPGARFTDAREMKSALLRVVPPTSFPRTDEIGAMLEGLMRSVDAPLPPAEHPGAPTATLEHDGGIHSADTQVLEGSGTTPIESLAADEPTEAA